MCDHHCIWLNNCVGYANYRWFLAYLVANIWLLSFGFYMTFGLLRTKVAESVDAGLPGSLISRWQAVALSDALRTTTCLMLLCGAMVWLVLAFFIQHLRYMYLGVTTNEAAKWEDVQDCIADGSIYMYYNQDGTPSEANILLQKDEAGCYNRKLTAHELQAVRDLKLELRECKSVADVNNIYDQGFRKNFRDRVFTTPF